MQHLLAVAVLMPLLGCAAASGSAERLPRLAANLLANPGFESGADGWSYPETSPYWGPFAVVDAPVHAGRRAAHLELRSGPGSPPDGTRVFGVTQELRAGDVPDVVGGFYRVGSWEKGADVTHLYLQFVAIVWGDPATAALVTPENPESGIRNYQIRYYLAGVNTPPFRLRNAKLEFVTREPPRLDEWVYFEIPLRSDFERLWGRVPEDFERIHLLFEARWDNKPTGSRIHADVYFDDLFAGPLAP